MNNSQPRKMHILINFARAQTFVQTAITLMNHVPQTAKLDSSWTCDHDMSIIATPYTDGHRSSPGLIPPCIAIAFAKLALNCALDQMGSTKPVLWATGLYRTLLQLQYPSSAAGATLQNESNNDVYIKPNTAASSSAVKTT